METNDYFDIEDIDSGSQMKQKIVRSYYTCKEKVDRYIAKTRMEEKRVKKVKDGMSDFNRQDPIDFQVSYVPYFIVSAEHEIKYLRKNYIRAQLDANVLALKIKEATFNRTDLQQIEDGAFQVNVLELVSHKNTDKIILDSKGKQIKEKEIPEFLPLNEQQYNAILEKQQISKSSLNESIMIENLKTSTIKRPQESIKTVSESITIDLNTILRAKYIGSFNLGKKPIEMTIDSVTGAAKIN